MLNVRRVELRLLLTLWMFAIKGHGRAVCPSYSLMSPSSWTGHQHHCSGHSISKLTFLTVSRPLLVLPGVRHCWMSNLQSQTYAIHMVTRFLNLETALWNLACLECPDLSSCNWNIIQAHFHCVVQTIAMVMYFYWTMWTSVTSVILERLWFNIHLQLLKHCHILPLVETCHLEGPAHVPP